MNEGAEDRNETKRGKMMSMKKISMLAALAAFLSPGL